MSNRIPPSNLDAEASALGAMIESKDAIANVVDFLKPEHFYDGRNRKTYEAILELEAKPDATVDILTVAERLDQRGDLESIGGKPFLLGLIESYPTATSAPRYARMVADTATLRALIDAGNQIQELGYSLPEDIRVAVDEAEKMIFEVGHLPGSRDANKLAGLLAEAFERFELRQSTDASLIGVPSGFSVLDEKTMGWRDGQLICVGARPAMGKTSLLGDFALHAARAGKTSLICSMEMSEEELAERFLSSTARVDSQRIKRGNLTQPHWDSLSGALANLAEAPIWIDDTAALTPMELRAKARRLKARGQLDLIIVDYLQLMSLPNVGRAAFENKPAVVGEISRSLKIMARELQVPVIAASQLNRGLEMRSDKRPMLQDLRESGGIEQDCDIVMFLYRDVVYHPDTQLGHTAAELIVSKHRNGPTGTVPLVWRGEYTSFANDLSGRSYAA